MENHCHISVQDTAGNISLHNLLPISTMSSSVWGINNTEMVHYKVSLVCISAMNSHQGNKIREALSIWEDTRRKKGTNEVLSDDKFQKNLKDQ